MDRFAGYVKFKRYKCQISQLT